MKKIWSDLVEDLKLSRQEIREMSIDPLTKILVLLFVFSCLDAYFTLVWIDAGLAIEANPVLAPLIKYGPFSFVATKLLLTGLGCLILYHAKRKSKIAAWSIVFLTLGYCVLTVYHIIGAILSADHTLLPAFVNDVVLFFL